MDFEIYVLGDVRLFADTLNGIAMMFTVANGERIDLWASNTNSMGLGMGAFLGMLLAICMLIYNAAFKQKFDYRAIILPLILYIVLTVPKVTVNVVDAYYRDGAQTVANVPLGLALPMSAISSIAFSATQKLETVFQVPNNGSFTKITEDGFVMPLKLLHSLRYAGLTMRDGFPNVTDSLAEVVKICLTNNETFDELEYQSSPNSFGVFYNALQDPIAGARVVRIYPSNKLEGELVQCSKAADYIKNAITGYIDGTVPALSLISQDDLKVKSLRTDIEKILAANNSNTGSRNLTNITSTRILSDIQNMTNVSNDEAINFVSATIFNPQLSTATECVVSTDNRDTARCFSYATAAEQWKEKSAAEASGFLSIMRDGQNLLILLSVTLFPIMVLIVVLQGLGGLKVVMSYLLYTISAYMWIPVASMINYYTQVQLDDELKKWAARIPAGSDVATVYLSLANAPLFYDAISKKLALANSVMASVPMICMGLFGGMLMTMNRLADKMNPQSGYNASTNTPAVMERGALAKVGSSISFDGVNSAGKLNGLPEMSTFTKAREASAQRQQAQTHLESSSKAARHAYGEGVNKGIINQDTKQLARQMTQETSFERNHQEAFQQFEGSVSTSQKMIAIGEKLQAGSSISTQEQKFLQQQANVGGSIQGGGKSAMKLGAELSQMGGTMLQNAFQTAFDKGLDVHAVGKKVGVDTSSWSNMSSRAEISRQIATASLIATATQATTSSEGYTRSKEDTKAFEHSLAEARSEMQSYTEAQKAVAGFEVKTSELATMDKMTHGELSKAIDQLYNEVAASDSNVAAAYNANSHEFTNTSGAHNADMVRKAVALNTGNTATKALMAERLGGVGALIGAGVNGNHIPSVDKGAYTVHNEVKGETEYAANMKPLGLTTKQVDAAAADLSGRVAATQADIEAKSRQQPDAHQRLVDAEAAVGKTSDEVMAAYKKLNAENNIDPHFPFKGKDGNSASLQVTSRGTLLAPYSAQETFVSMEIDRMHKIVKSGGKLSSEDQKLWDSFSENYPQGSRLHPASWGSAGLGYMTAALETKDKPAITMKIKNAEGEIKDVNLSVYEAGKFQYLHNDARKKIGLAPLPITTVGSQPVVTAGESAANQSETQEAVRTQEPFQNITGQAKAKLDK